MDPTPPKQVSFGPAKPFPPRQRREEAASHALADHLRQLKSTIHDALDATNGNALSSIASAIQGAVNRARKKAKIVPTMQMDIVLAAIDDVLWEIGSIEGATNAMLMRKLTEEEQCRHATAPRDASDSVQSQRGTLDPSEDQHGSEKIPSSVISRISYGTMPPPGEVEEVESTASGGGSGPHPSSTPPYPSSTSIIIDTVIEPLRQLTIECTTTTITSTSTPTTSDSFPPRIATTPRRSPSSDLRLARSVDFDECSSPRIRGSCVEHGFTPQGDPQRVVPMHPYVSQYHPTATSSAEESPRGGQGAILVLKGNQQQHPGSFSPSPYSSSSSPSSPPSPSSLERIGWRQWRLHRFTKHAHHPPQDAQPTTARSMSPPTPSPLSSAAVSFSSTTLEKKMNVSDPLWCESNVVPPGMEPTARIEGFRVVEEGEGEGQEGSGSGSSGGDSRGVGGWEAREGVRKSTVEADIASLSSKLAKQKV